MNTGCFPDHAIRLNQNRYAFRLLRVEDIDALASYFLSLSEHTKSMYAPHPFTREQAEKICGDLHEDTSVRVIAVSQDGTIAAYFILAGSVGEGDRKRYAELGITLGTDDCALAPSVADGHQNAGLGSELLRYCVEALACAGVKRLILMGGVKDENERGKHFYEKNGFRRLGSFDNGVLNFDMALEIAAPATRET